MEQQFERVHNRLDEINERMNNIDKTLVRQEGQLAEHMRRSLANEEAVERIANELKPVLNHVEVVKFVGKVVGLVLGSGLLATILNYVLK